MLAVGRDGEQDAGGKGRSGHSSGEDKVVVVAVVGTGTLEVLAVGRKAGRPRRMAFAAGGTRENIRSTPASYARDQERPDRYRTLWRRLPGKQCTCQVPTVPSVGPPQAVGDRRQYQMQQAAPDPSEDSSNPNKALQPASRTNPASLKACQGHKESAKKPITPAGKLPVLPCPAAFAPASRGPSHQHPPCGVCLLALSGVSSLQTCFCPVDNTSYPAAPGCSGQSPEYIRPTSTSDDLFAQRHKWRQ